MGILYFIGIIEMEGDISLTPIEIILKTPRIYPWNIVLRVKQLTQEQILMYSHYCDIKDIVRFQRSATYDFIKDNFSEDVDGSLDIDWDDVERFTQRR